MIEGGEDPLIAGTASMIQKVGGLVPASRMITSGSTLETLIEMPAVAILGDACPGKPGVI